MKHFILIILFSAVSFYSNSQSLESDTLLARKYMNEGKRLHSEYKLNEALEKFNKAESIYSKLHLKDALLACNLERAEVLIEQSELNEALSVLESGMAMIKKTKGENNTLFVDYSEKKGLLYYYAGDYTEAKNLWIKTLVIAKRVYGSESVKVSDIDNNIGGLYSTIGEYFKALKLHQTALDIREKNLDDDDLKIAVSLTNVGNIYAEIGNTDLALDYYLKALRIKQKKLGPYDFAMASLYNHLGTVYHILADEHRAESYFEKSLKIRKQYLGDDHPKTAEVYTKLAEVYNSKGKYKKSSDYHLKALFTFEDVLGKKHPFIPKILKDIGAVYLNTDSLDKAKEYFNLAIELTMQIYGPEKKEVAKIYLEVGDLYYRKFNDLSPMNFFERALQIQEKIYVGKHPDLAETLQKIGKVYLEQEEYYEALKYYNKCLAMRNIMFGNKHPRTAEIYYMIAEVYEEKNEFASEQKYLQKALVSNIKQFNSENSSVLPIPDRNLKQIYDRDLLLNTLTKKAMAYKQIYFRTNKVEDLDKAFKVYEISDAVLDRIRQFAVTSKEIEEAENNMAVVYEEAVNICMLLYKKTNKFKYFEKAFQYSEKYKAGRIAHVLPFIDVSLYTGVSDSVLRYENTLKADIFYFRKRSENEPTDAKLSDKLFDLESKHDEFVSDLKEQYEDYYFVKYKPYNKSFNEIVQVLDDSSMMVSYFTTDDSKFLYVFTLAKDKGHMYFMNKEDAYNSGIRKVKRFLNSDDNGNIAGFKNTAYELYKMLIPESLNNESSVKQLIIIPNDELSDLPFEVLFTKQYKGGDNFSGFPYLIKKFGVSYFYSANLFYENFYVDSTLIPDNKLNDTTIVSDYNITDSAFVSNYDKIDTTLVQDYDLRDKLTVMTIGDAEITNNNKGRGVLGLTLSLISEESMNIIAPLWEVSDNEDYMIEYYEDYMIDFEEKENLSGSFRDAKLQLIKDHKYAHPFFWSSFVLIGK